MKVLVTGGNRGIGYAMAHALAGRGVDVVITARDPERGAAARDRLRLEHPAADVQVLTLDVSDPDAIRRRAAELVAELHADHATLDGLIHNAGLLMPPPTRTLTAEGVEVTLATNALGPLLLTQLLAPALAPTAKVLGLTSRLHLPGSRGDEVDFSFDDPNLDHGYSPDRAYKNSKLALIWVCRELDRRLADGVAVQAVCPGFAPETASQYATGRRTRFLMRHVLPHLPFTVTVDQAADDVLWALEAPELAGRGGLYLADRAIADASPDADDPAQAARFWQLAHELWPTAG